jgi:hypothetical protein
LNNFQLFALMLRFKDARRLPGGIRLELQRDTPRLFNGNSKNMDTATVSSAQASYIYLKVNTTTFFPAHGQMHS